VYNEIEGVGIISGFSMRVECVPVPKGRPRFTRYGGAYTPKETVEFEQVIAAAWLEQQGATMLEGDIELFVAVSVVNMKKDIDNLVKSIADGLTKAGAWHDDRQITQLHAWKFPASKGDESVHVIVRKVNP
jgi:Holliday junction resolvase RusA-like endonuclease